MGLPSEERRGAQATTAFDSLSRAGARRLLALAPAAKPVCVLAEGGESPLFCPPCTLRLSQSSIRSCSSEGCWNAVDLTRHPFSVKFASHCPFVATNRIELRQGNRTSCSSTCKRRRVVKPAKK
jgi:hypothetical protein